MNQNEKIRWSLNLDNSDILYIKKKKNNNINLNFRITYNLNQPFFYFEINTLKYLNTLEGIYLQTYVGIVIWNCVHLGSRALVSHLSLFFSYIFFSFFFFTFFIQFLKFWGRGSWPFGPTTWIRPCIFLRNWGTDCV